MRIAVVGSRDFDDDILMHQVLDDIVVKQFPDVMIISGGARGADLMAEDYAKINGILCEIHLADWETYGKSAGFIRNDKVIKNADLCIAFWDGKSKGTQHAIGLCSKYHVGVKLIPVKEKPIRVNPTTGRLIPCECT